MSSIQQSRLALPILLVLICLAYLFRGVLVIPPAVDPDHPFNTARAFERLGRILGDERPHPVDTAANDAVRERLLSEIEMLGFEPVVGDVFHCKEGRRRGTCARLRNIAFWVTEPGPNAVLIASHYDSVPAGPGASDDGAGVAASLEIAALLKAQDLNRPVLVLITDGEEIGLMGAEYFVKADPLAQMVGAVVNMEARGVAGLAALIQTSRPNGRDLAVLDSTTRLPAASSLNADIFDLLPNDTDMTEFLALDIDAANLAFAGRPSLYHTPGDNLANLDQRSLFNIGASGLAAAEAFLGQSGDEQDVQLLYVDVLGRAVLKFPVWLGGFVLGLSLLCAFWLLWREGRSVRHRLKLLALPPLALGVGVLLAILANMLVDAVRADRFFGAAYPMALRGLHIAAGLTGALIPYTFLARASEARGLLAGAWVLLALVGGLAFVLVPGASIAFVPSATMFAIAALGLGLGLNRLGNIAAASGIGVFVILLLPLTALGETGLLIEASAPFAAIGVMIFLFVVPYVWPPEVHFLRRFWLSGLATGGVAIGFLVASLVVPAHSADAPRGLSVTHIQGDGLDGAYYTVPGSKPVPEPMRDIAPFERGPLEPVYSGSVQHAPAPGFASSGILVDILEDRIADEIRILSMKVSAPDSDRLVFVFEGETKLSAMQINTQRFDPEDGLPNAYLCQGRACRNVRMDFAFGASDPAPELGIYAARFGLDAGSDALLEARPDTATARQMGDNRLIVKMITFDPDEATGPAP
jgi:hypothetical protein